MEQRAIGLGQRQSTFRSMVAKSSTLKILDNLFISSKGRSSVNPVNLRFFSDLNPPDYDLSGRLIYSREVEIDTESIRV
jgi:hypothetical protein